MDISEARTILGVDVNTSQEEIKQAYRILIKSYHPDKNPHLTNAEKRTFSQKYQRIQEAYETLRTIKQSNQQKNQDTYYKSRGETYDEFKKRKSKERQEQKKRAKRDREEQNRQDRERRIRAWASREKQDRERQEQQERKERIRQTVIEEEEDRRDREVKKRKQYRYSSKNFQKEQDNQKRKEFDKKIIISAIISFGFIFLLLIAYTMFFY